MTTFTLDTSCMIAVVSSWHEHQTAATREIEARLEHGERLVICAPALVEAYSVLTRLPAPQRVAPTDAWTLIRENFVRRFTVVALSARNYVAVLDAAARLGVGGGRAYDAVIAACARQAKADVLLTFNSRDFHPPPEGLAVVEPPGTGR